MENDKVEEAAGLRVILFNLEKKQRYSEKRKRKAICIPIAITKRTERMGDLSYVRIRGFPTSMVGVSLLCIMLEIHHSGREPSRCSAIKIITNKDQKDFLKDRYRGNNIR